MEFLPLFTNNGFMFAFLAVICSLCLWAYHNSGRNSNAQNPNHAPPQAAGAWPIIGHLHLLGGSTLPHITLGHMADTYGPIFTIKLGVHQTIVVSDWKIAKECFTTNDKAFANRPKSMAVELIGYNYAMFGLGPYGEYWRQMRQMATHEILSPKQLDKLSHLRASEVKALIKDIYELWHSKNNKKAADSSSGKLGMVKVEMKQWFGRLTLNMVVQMLAGKRYSSKDEQGEGGRSSKAIRKYLELLGTLVVGDAIPSLRWLDLGGYEKVMKKCAKEIDGILQRWLDEHKANKHSGDSQDFINVMLTNLKEGTSTKDLGGYDRETITKATCLALLAGATDTTLVILTWAFSLLINNRHELQKAQEEVDLHVGRNRRVEESDIKNLVYLNAIVKESMRLYPAGQLLAPRESMKDCSLAGYHIPKGTRLVLNLSKIHRDPKVWADPNEFRPERFLGAHRDVDVKGKHFELLPFGSGMRMCPGASLGLQIVELTLANLIHGFEFETPFNEATDMSMSIGLNNLKATPLEVYLSPRLSFYGE